MSSKARSSIATLARNSVTHRPEPLTELSFENPSALPATYISGQMVPVAFDVHDLEYRDMTYRYRVYATDDDTPPGNDTAPIHTIKVADKGTATVRLAVPATGDSARVKVVVELVDQRQSIHFWLEHTN